MKDRFGDGIDLQIHLTSSEEAMKYRIRSATSVLADGEWVPIDIALSEERMSAFLDGKLKGSSRD